MSEREPPVGPLDALRHPRYAGLRTFARLPAIESVGRADVAVLGAPFDGGASFRPGARFGPAAIREASLLLRPYNEPLDTSPFAEAQVADAGRRAQPVRPRRGPWRGGGARRGAARRGNA